MTWRLEITTDRCPTYKWKINKIKQTAKLSWDVKTKEPSPNCDQFSISLDDHYAIVCLFVCRPVRADCWPMGHRPICSKFRFAIIWRWSLINKQQTNKHKLNKCALFSVAFFCLFLVFVYIQVCLFVYLFVCLFVCLFAQSVMFMYKYNLRTC